MAELYDFTVEIYEYGNEPVRVFNKSKDQNQSKVVLRLSYHSRNHYNAVTPLNWSPISDYALE